VVERAALEMRFTGNRNVGSNPTLSASDPQHRSPIGGSLRHCQKESRGRGRALICGQDEQSQTR
jgi:hypothetical protein